ncbi:MAG: helix-hairpin-helix domain-containing protein [Myxococcota bacterium]
MARRILALAVIVATLQAAHAWAGSHADAPQPSGQAERAAEGKGHPTPSNEPPGPCINLNTAGVTSLTTLPGIGPSRAEAIVVSRQKRPFRRIEDILRVPGVGRKTFGRIRAMICVK